MSRSGAPDTIDISLTNIGQPDTYNDYAVHPETPEDIDRQLLNIEAAISLTREQHVPKPHPVSNT